MLTTIRVKANTLIFKEGGYDKTMFIVLDGCVKIYVERNNEEIELAIDEFLLEWVDFEEHFEADENRTELHPYYGNLNYNQWCRLHSKHLTHHFEQFGII